MLVRLVNKSLVRESQEVKIFLIITYVYYFYILVEKQMAMLSSSLQVIKYSFDVQFGVFFIRHQEYFLIHIL
jgi:hypothetical protein